MRRSIIEPLETRQLLSVSVAASDPVNLTKLPGNQSEGAIAVDPTNPSRLFAFSNTDETGMIAATSNDAGQTWSTRLIANGHDNLEPACCDPSAVFDSFGNLFIAYVNEATSAVDVAISTDGGQSFTTVTRFKGDIDQPTLAVGPGALWITFAKGSPVYVAGATVTGLGQIRPFGALQKISGSTDGNFGDITVGPSGQVVVGYEVFDSDSDPSSTLYVNIDPDGLGPAPFGPAIKLAKVNMGGFTKITPQHARSVDAELSLGFDNSGGPYRGRLYATYTDRPTPSGNDTNVFVRHSDTNGTLWSGPERVNDDTGVNSQFLPKMSVDPTTGLVGFSWHDSRNDLGQPGTGSSDTVVDNDAEFFAAAGVPTSTGLEISANVRVSGGTSNAADASNDIDFGDFTGISFYNGSFHSIWSDNSNSTQDNPEGALAPFDMYTATMTVAGDVPSGVAGSGLVQTFSAKFLGKSSVSKGSSFSFGINYTDPALLLPFTFDSTNVLITSSKGVTQLARLQSVKLGSNRTTATVTYKFTAPSATFKVADNGVYTVSIVPGTIGDLAGHSNPGIVAGHFTVAVKAAKGKVAVSGRTAPLVSGLFSRDASNRVLEFGEDDWLA